MKKAALILAIFLLSSLVIPMTGEKGKAAELSGTFNQNGVFGNQSMLPNSTSTTWAAVGYSGVTTSQSGAKYGFNSSTNETHVLTFSSSSATTSYHNHKLVFATFQQNGTSSNKTYHNFSSNHLITDKNFHITPAGRVYVYAMKYSSSAGGYQGMFYKSSLRNISTMTNLLANWEDSYGQGFGFVGNEETVSHVGLRNVNYNYNQGTATYQDLRIRDMDDVGEYYNKQCVTSSGSCNFSLYSAAVTPTNDTLVSFRDPYTSWEKRHTMGWAAHNDSSWTIHSGPTTDTGFMVAYSHLHGAVMKNSTDVYTVNPSNLSVNTSVNQSMTSLISPTTSGNSWDHLHIDLRGHWQLGNSFFNPYNGRIVNYSLSASTVAHHLGNGAYLSKTGGVSIYDYDRDGFTYSSDVCPHSNPDYWGADYDSDGCYDIEDEDIDGDGILNLYDPFPSDLCGDTDTDGDGLPDVLLCPSNETSLIEDMNDDNDSFPDDVDSCDAGYTNWTYSYSIDHDYDGCHDAFEDTNDDNDSIADVNDLCPTGLTNWTSNSSNDYDLDGCFDQTEDHDDDNDGQNDSQDLWPLDAEAYGLDTDGDLLPDNVHLLHRNLSVDHSMVWPGVSFIINLEDYPKVSYGYTSHWVVPNQLNSSTPIALADSSSLVQNQQPLEFMFRGSGNLFVEYFKDSHDCNFSIIVDGTSHQMHDGRVNFSSQLDFGNHTLQLRYFENNSISDCSSTTLMLYRIQLPLEGETNNGVREDIDDDNDGYLDVNETSGVCGTISDPLRNNSTPPDLDNDFICDAMDSDRDGDSFENTNDAFPDDPLEWTDLDFDGVGDNSDIDVDGDLVNNSVDAWPNDPCVAFDHDSDGLADNVVLGCQTSVQQDGDDDNDGKLDQDDFCPLGQLNWLSGAVTDHDSDGCADGSEDDDDDNDGLSDIVDLCPKGHTGWLSNPVADADGDGCHDSIEDNDDDNDGVIDTSDFCSNTPANVTVDSNGCPVDSDQDGVPNYLDLCNSTLSGVVVDQDGCPVDSDADGVPDYLDAFPEDANETDDSDNDGVGDNSDAFPNDGTESLDSDMDGIGDNSDAFPADATETLDTDMDGVGDNADAFPDDASETVDSDMDGVGDNADAFPDDASETVDSDMDGVGDNADAFPDDASETVDSDMDGVGDNVDAFPDDASETVDSDMDGVGDNADAFPDDASETVDSDMDGVGDNADAFPDDASETVDSDMDGVGDNADAFPNDPAKSVVSTISPVLGIASVLLATILIGFVVIRRQSKPRKSVVPIEPSGDESQIETVMPSGEGLSEAASSVSGPPQDSSALTAVPSADSTGVVGDDGYEWLEFPENSGEYFYRVPGTESWQKWD